MSIFTAQIFILGGGGSGNSGDPGFVYPAAGAGSVPVYDASHTLVFGQIYPVVVGEGGIQAYPGHGEVGNDGGDSSFDGLTSTGGGHPSTFGSNVGGANTSYSGGTGAFTGGSTSGGGGAGAGGNGGGFRGKNGGIGVSNSISGSVVTYGGGGPGLDADGDGTYQDGAGHSFVNADANRGGGGAYESDGGSGVVIISYPTPSFGDGTGGVITHVGGNTIHTFNASGVFLAPSQQPTPPVPANVSLLEYYVSILILQYRPKPKFQAMNRLVANQSTCDGLFLQLQNCFNLDQAIGAQLTILGKIVGVPRNVFGINPFAVYFSFTRAAGTPASVGFNRATTPVDSDFFLRAQVQSSYTLTDFELLNLIYLKIIYNNTYSSFRALKNALYNRWNGAIDIIADSTTTEFFNFTRALSEPPSNGFNRSTTPSDTKFFMRASEYNLMKLNYVVYQPYYTVMQVAQFLNIVPRSMGVTANVQYL